MSVAAEAVYFDGAPFAHIVAYEEHRRLQRIRAACDAALRRGGPWLPRYVAGPR